MSEAKTVDSAPAVAPRSSDATLSAFMWKNAEDLWGNFKHTDFGKIILPFTLLRRLDGDGAVADFSLRLPPLRFRAGTNRDLSGKNGKTLHNRRINDINP